MDEGTAEFEALVHFFEELIPFNKYLGLQVERIAVGETRMMIPFASWLVGDPNRPALHGGVTSALADAAGGLAALTTLEPGTAVSTIDLRIDFLEHGLTDEALWCEAHVRRTGARVVVVHMQVLQRGNDRLVAEGRGAYSINRRSASTRP